MKYTHIILGISLLTLLVSCDIQKEENLVQEKPAEQILKTNKENMASLSGSVVIDINHALAGKTLIFDVEIVTITKGEGNSEADTVENGDAIGVHYTGTLEDGEVFDSSRERNQTLQFEVGAGQMIPGFDSWVVGMKKDESKTLTLAPEDAYGAHDPERTQTIPKADLASFTAAGYKLEVGEKLPTQYGEFEIIEVTEE